MSQPVWEDLSSEPLVAVTADQDWAPEWAMAELIRFARAEAVPLHVFVTNPSPALERAAASGEVTLGIHPNFRPGSSHGDDPEDVIAHCRALVPSATTFRTHSFYENSGSTSAPAAQRVRRGLQHLPVPPARARSVRARSGADPISGVYRGRQHAPMATRDRCRRGPTAAVSHTWSEDRQCAPCALRNECSRSPLLRGAPRRVLRRRRALHAVSVPRHRHRDGDQADSRVDSSPGCEGGELREAGDLLSQSARGCRTTRAREVAERRRCSWAPRPK